MRAYFGCRLNDNELPIISLLLLCPGILLYQRIGKALRIRTPISYALGVGYQQSASIALVVFIRQLYIFLGDSYK
jgi:hypothetical protein